MKLIDEPGKQSCETYCSIDHPFAFTGFVPIIDKNQPAF